MTEKRLGIGVVGAGRWASLAHLPGWARDGRCEIIGICDTEPGRAGAAARKLSHHERRWVSLPLAAEPVDGNGR